MIAIDTNILIHAHRRDASFHLAAKNTIQDLAESLSPWSICYHSLIEFYAVCTQPKIWHEASTPWQVFKQIKAWRAAPRLRILTETAADISLETLEKLAVESKVRGPLIHDARIAACCLANGVTELWTLDRDFSRFPLLKIRNPLL